MSRTIAVALVGFGAAGHQHAAAVAESGAAHVRAVVDPDPAVDTAPHRRVPGLDDVLADAGTDLVALCTPPGGRAEEAHRVLRAGKALLLEKPPATTTAEFDALVAEVRGRGAVAGVMFQHRMRLPDEVRALEWGPATTAVLEISRRRTDAHYFPPSWRSEPARAMGATLPHLASHYLDLACGFLGEPAEVRLLGRRERRPGIDSRGAGVVRFAAGPVLSFAATSESLERRDRLAVYGEECRLVIEDGQSEISDGTRSERFPVVSIPQARARVYREMAGAVSGGPPPVRCALADARGVTAILQAAAESGGARAG